MSKRDSDRLESNFRSTWDRWKEILTEKPDEADWSTRVNAGNTEVWWISGSTTFCDQLLGEATNCPRVVCRIGSRRTPPTTSKAEWYQIAHQNVGGSTNARGTFCLTNLPSLSIPQDLPRNLSHVIKHSIRGEPCSIPLLEAHYSVNDRLSLGKLTQPVLIESFYSRSGWAKRPLVAEEFEMAFNLPESVRWDDSFVGRVPPLQILSAVMESILSGMESDGTAPAKRIKQLPTPSLGTCDDRVWLPSLGRWMPGSWSETAISDKAVKADCADIDFFPWNQRIRLVLPWITPRVIKIMERLCYTRWCRSLFSSFSRYLRARYGTNWPSKLGQLRRIRRSSRLEGGSPPKSLPKGGVSGLSPSIKGVVTDTSKRRDVTDTSKGRDVTETSKR